MRWPRFLRRRPKSHPWADAPPPTFHTEQCTVMTNDGPMEVSVPLLDGDFWGGGPLFPEHVPAAMLADILGIEVTPDD